MKPSNKSPAIEQILEEFGGRTTAITSNHCIPAPLGCGQPIGNVEHHFRDNLSLAEYKLSGWCQECQDLVFKHQAEEGE